MKKLFTLGASFMLASTLAMAQPDPKEMVSRQMERYQSELKLTTEQTPKLQVILLAQAEKMMKVFEEGNGDREAMMASMQKMQTETSGKVKEVLTAEQFKKYEELLAQQRANRPQQ